MSILTNYNLDYKLSHCTLPRFQRNSKCENIISVRPYDMKRSGAAPDRTAGLVYVVER